MPRSSVISSYVASSSSTFSSSASSSSASPSSASPSSASSSSASSPTATPCSAPVYASESFILGSTCSPSPKSDPHVLSREEEEELFGRDEPQEDVPEDNTRAKDGLSDQEIPDGSLGGFKTNSAAQLSAESSSTVPLMESPKPNRVEEDREPTKAPARDEVVPESSTSKITETSKKASKKSAGKRKQLNESDKGFRDYRPLPRRVMQLRPMPASVLIPPICTEDWQQQADAVEAKAQEEFRQKVREFYEPLGAPYPKDW